MPIYNVVPKDPNDPVEVEKISDILTWDEDLALVKKLLQPMVDQSYRETRLSVKSHPDKNQRYVHNYEFGFEISKLMENIALRLATDCPDGDPTFESVPDWFSYIKLYTEGERRQIDYAKQQRGYKQAIVLELEELIIPNDDLEICKLKSDNETRRRNRWLVSFVNDFPELEVGATSDQFPYLQTLEVVTTLPVKRKRGAKK